MAQWLSLPLPMQWVWIWSLVRKQGFHVLKGAANKCLKISKTCKTCYFKKVHYLHGSNCRRLGRAGSKGVGKRQGAALSCVDVRGCERQEQTHSPETSHRELLSWHLNLSAPRVPKQIRQHAKPAQIP